MTSNAEINILIDQVLIHLQHLEADSLPHIQHFIYDTVAFLAALYNEKSSLKKPQMENFIERLAAKVFNDNNHIQLTIECLRTLINAIFPKVSAEWDNPSKANLFGILKKVQEFVITSEEFSEDSRTKFLMTDLLKLMSLRFHINAEIKDGSTPEDVFTVDDLRSFTQKLAKIAIPKP